MAAVEGTKEWTRDGTGFTWDLSEPQAKILDEFMAENEAALNRVKFVHEPVREAAARFLRARKYDKTAAAEMLETSRAWRESNNIEALAAVPDEEITGCPAEEIESLWPCAHLPVCDAHGRPVYIERTGQVEVDALLCSTTSEALLELHKKLMVTTTPLKMAKATKDRSDGRVVNSSTTIMDLHGFTLSMLMGSTKDYLSKMMKMDSDNFPETLGTTLIINAPTIFSVAWGIVKGFIDPRTQAKIIVTGANYQEKLFELMGGPENVPVEYGGTLTVPGIFRNSLVRVAVHAGKKHTVAVRVRAGHGGRVRWTSDPADIVFGVVAVTGDEATLAAAEADPAGFDASSCAVVYEAKAHPRSNKETTECLLEEASEDTVLLATWDNSAGWSQRFVRFLAQEMPTKAERADKYVEAMRKSGVSKADMVKALTTRGYTDKAAEVEAEPDDAAAAGAGEEEEDAAASSSSSSYASASSAAASSAAESADATEAAKEADASSA